MQRTQFGVYRNLVRKIGLEMLIIIKIIGELIINKRASYIKNRISLAFQSIAVS